MDSEPHKTPYVYVNTIINSFLVQENAYRVCYAKYSYSKLGNLRFFLHLSESPSLSGMVTGLSIITQ